MVMKKVDTVNLVALLNHLCIDPESDNRDIISELMNFTLQSLGAIRMLVQEQENDRTSILASQIPNIAELCDSDTKNRTLRETFASAVSLITDRIVTGREIHDLDPSRHLIESFPHSIKIGSKQWLALHWAIIADRDRPIECTSVTSSPRKSYRKHPDIDHCNSLVDTRLERVKTLATAWPDMCAEVDKEGRSILHFAARLDSVELFLQVAECSSLPYGRGIDYANMNGALPLHNAARFCKSIEVFNHVVAMSPAANFLTNNDGNLPLHWAAAKNHNVEIINTLLQLNPAAAHTSNNEGYLPIHCAGQNNNLEVVKSIYAAHPEGIKVCDDEGGYPLHHACYINKNIDVVKFFYHAFPEAMSYPQYNGVTPMHLAATQNDSPEVLAFILEVTPSAAYVIDHEGWLALHCLLHTDACKMTSSRVECLKLLLKANPRAITSADLEIVERSPSPLVSVVVPDNGSISNIKNVLSPYDMAMSQKHGELILRMVLNANPAQNLVAYGDLNWKSRKWFVFACLYAAGQDVVAKSAADGKVMNYESPDSRENVLRLLCIKYIAETSKNVPAGVLRKIIKFL